MPDQPLPLQGFGSTAVHGGHEQDPRYAHQTPIYASSTFVYDTAEQGMRRFSGQEAGYIYTRWGNPTATEAEAKIAALECFDIIDPFGHPLTAKGLLHASGMAAITTLMLSVLKKGDKVLTHYSLYGGTQDLLENVLPGLGIEAVITDLHNMETAAKILETDPAIKMIYLETPANPTLRCVDIEALTQLAKHQRKLVACDNTFATPYLQQPFRYGVDFIVHSTTKFLNGHGTAVGGILLGRDTDFMKERAYKTYKTLGGSSNAFDAFLLVNGLKTLEIRMERHCRNAMETARFLEAHPAVARVHYNGLPSHPDHAISNKQMRYAGAMISFELKEGLPAGIRMMDQLSMCTRTVSLGTCDTLLCHPASMTHYSVPKEKREQYGITDGLIRMSVGIENIQDIITDLSQALK